MKEPRERKQRSDRRIIPRIRAISCWYADWSVQLRCLFRISRYDAVQVAGMPRINRAKPFLPASR